MNDCYITFRSITRAQRGSGLLDRAGISHQLCRTPKSLASQGCGYALRVHPPSIYAAAQMLQQNEIAYQRIFNAYEDGRIEEALL